MQSKRSSNTRFIALVIGAVALLFGGIVGLALAGGGGKRATKPTPTAVTALKPAPKATSTKAAPKPGAATVMATAPEPSASVPPTIDTGPAAGTGERVAVDDVVRGPWEVVDLAAPAKPAAKATPASTGASVTPETKRVAPAPTAKVVASPAPDRAASEVARVPIVVPAVEPRVTVLESAIATDVADREPVGAAEAFTVGVDRVWAWIKVKNDGAPTFVTMVWRKGDEIAFRLKLDVGTSPGWRTWSNKTLRTWDAGEWTVDVFDANGLRVGALQFDVEPAAAADPS